MPDTVCPGRVCAVSFGNMRSALAVHFLSILAMRCRIARTVSIANESPEVEAVVSRNFAPALPGLMRCNHIVKALA